jgi:hypothetical protein
VYELYQNFDRTSYVEIFGSSAADPATISNLFISADPLKETYEIYYFLAVSLRPTGRAFTRGRDGGVLYRCDPLAELLL